MSNKRNSKKRSGNPGKPVNIPVDFDRAMDVFANMPPPNKRKGGKARPSMP